MACEPPIAFPLSRQNPYVMAVTLQQLSGVDAGFLHMETDRSFGHVSSLSIYERPDDPGLRALPGVATTSSRAPAPHRAARRRLVEVPFGLDRPYWIADPDFDLDFHVRHPALPPPGNDEQLAEQVARIIGRPLDRSRPLWEVYVIEGLADDDFAILTKVHHATVDGASGVELLTIMLDADARRYEGGASGDAVEARPRAVVVGAAAPGRRSTSRSTRVGPAA